MRVWQKAMDLAVEIHELTKRFPVEEKYSLTDQVRRSSRSVAANLAEGWRKRRYPNSFVAKLTDSEGEGAETQTHLEMAWRLGYLTEDVFRRLDEECESILAMLVRMSSRPEEWAIKKRGN